MKKHNFLAFDIGATSGRAVLVSLMNGKFEMRELHRFPNNLLELHGKYYWNIYNLYEELKKSLSLLPGKISRSIRSALIPGELISVIWLRMVLYWGCPGRTAIRIRKVHWRNISAWCRVRKSTG